MTNNPTVEKVLCNHEFAGTHPGTFRCKKCGISLDDDALARFEHALAATRHTNFSTGFLGKDTSYTLSFSGLVTSKEIGVLIQKLTVDRDFMQQQEDSRDLGHI